MDDVLFTIIATITGGSAIMVVITQDIVRCAVWLLFTLIGVSTLYFSLGADFVGATQLIVYVGGTMVLVVFGIMLTAQEQFRKIQTKPAEWITGSILAVALVLVLMNVNRSLGEQHTTPAVEELPSATPIGVAFLTRYLVPFEIISVHLLVVLIGAAYLARARRSQKNGAA